MEFNHSKIKLSSHTAGALCTDFEKMRENRRIEIERERRARAQQEYNYKIDNLSQMGLDGYYEYKVVDLSDSDSGGIYTEKIENTY